MTVVADIAKTKRRLVLILHLRKPTVQSESPYFGWITSLTQPLLFVNVPDLTLLIIMVLVGENSILFSPHFAKHT
jgi:hypothetical protein